MPKKEMPPDVLINLIWLEAKNVLRGIPSELFPDMTTMKARVIRMMGFEQFKKKFMEGIENNG